MLLLIGLVSFVFPVDLTVLATFALVRAGALDRSDVVSEAEDNWHLVPPFVRLEVLYEAWRATGDRAYLDQARDLLEHVFDACDERLRGALSSGVPHIRELLRELGGPWSQRPEEDERATLAQ